MEPLQQPIAPVKTFPSVSMPILILIMIVVSALSSFITYILMSRQNKPEIITNQVISPTSPVINLSPTPNTQISDLNFLKRQYDKSAKFFFTSEYPKEILSITDSGLTGMRCTKQYLRGADGSYTLGADSQVKLTDPMILQKITAATNFLNSQTIDATEICDTEDGRSIIAFESWRGGGGSGNIAYFGVISPNGSFKQITSIPTDYSPYFTCQNPLQLTNNNILYYQCGGGDGGGGSASVFSIDLNSNTHKLVMKCITESSGVEGAPSKTSCN